MRKRVIVGALGAVVLIGGGLYVSLCACVTFRDLAEDEVRAEIQRVLDAQQVFFTGHGRYAKTLAELGYVVDSVVDVDLLTVSDSGVRISGTHVQMPEVTCSIPVSPTTNAPDPLGCTR